jgi:hypothetical protein
MVVVGMGGRHRVSSVLSSVRVDAEGLVARFL